ncbi:hypothetical protein OXX69_002080 [Metschnikowia pulcherrima]
MSTPKSKKGASSALTPPTKKLRNNRGVAQNPILRGTSETSSETPQDPNGSNDEGEDEDDVDYVSEVDDDDQDNIEATPSLDDFMDQVLLLNHKRQSPWTERDAPSCATFVASQVVSQHPLR